MHKNTDLNNYKYRGSAYEKLWRKHWRFHKSKGDLPINYIKNTYNVYRKIL